MRWLLQKLSEVEDNPPLEAGNNQHASPWRDSFGQTWIPAATFGEWRLEGLSLVFLAGELLLVRGITVKQ